MTGTVQHARWSPSSSPGQEWWELLRAELTLTPERTARMARMTVLVMLVVLISMALRVPEAAISAYMIFFAARDDGPSSVKSAIGLIVAITGALLVGLVLLSLTEGEPVLRLAGVVALTLVAMYAQRRSPKLGLLGYAVGFVVRDVPGLRRALSHARADAAGDVVALGRHRVPRRPAGGLRGHLRR